jgi:hypothetical protein
MDGMIAKGCEKIGITKAFTHDFQEEAMEAIALTPLFTFIPKVKKSNDENDNKIDPTNSIIKVIDNCLQPSPIPIGMATAIGCASTSSNVKIFGLKQQARLKQKKLDQSKKTRTF